MSAEHFHREHHYVSQGYLKRWASSQRRLYVYRLLVSHAQVRAWKEVSVKGVAYRSHLYTRIVAGRETDDFERWLDREFEAPAEEPLEKATSDARLTPNDWKCLVRFLAAQDVRTPARFVETSQRWNQTLPGILDNTLQDVARELREARDRGGIVQQEPIGETEYVHIPLRVTRESMPGPNAGKLKAEVVIGRSVWLFSMQHLLKKTVSVLQQQKWTILLPPEGMHWVTSDDPVIKLNYYGSDNYDFKGGWGSRGTEILLPLSPRHLLYAKVGQRPPSRGEIPRHQAEMIRRFIAEHAHRLIFAAEPDLEVLRLRPRMVNADLFHDENALWRRWHAEQSTAEREVVG